jgi:hypothetical protein
MGGRRGGERRGRRVSRVAGIKVESRAVAGRVRVGGRSIGVIAGPRMRGKAVAVAAAIVMPPAAIVAAIVAVVSHGIVVGS